MLSECKGVYNTLLQDCSISLPVRASRSFEKRYTMPKIVADSCVTRIRLVSSRIFRNRARCLRMNLEMRLVI